MIEGQKDPSPIEEKEQHKFPEDFSKELLSCPINQDPIFYDCIRDIKEQFKEIIQAKQLILRKNKTIKSLIREMAEWLKELKIISDLHEYAQG